MHRGEVLDLTGYTTVARYLVKVWYEDKDALRVYLDPSPRDVVVALPHGPRVCRSDDIRLGPIWIRLKWQMPWFGFLPRADTRHRGM
jgi:hypothetical protein